MAESKKHESESDLDYEADSGESEREKELPVNLVRKLMKGGLGQSIREFMVQELEKFKKDEASGETVPNNTDASSGVGHTGGRYRADSGHSGCSLSCSGQRVRAGSEILEPFDPDNKDCNIEKWLAKIDQLGEIHGWSEYERAYFMQAKLQGAARAWYNRLVNYDLSWVEWRRALKQAFPREHDYVELLQEMLARVKMESESMTHYYHAKVGLIERCEITGRKALSCLIKGLPLDLQGNARAFKCNSCSELYTGFLSSFDRYQAPSSSSSGDNGASKRRTTGSVGDHGQSKVSKFYEKTRDAASAQDLVRCYNCQKVGTHISKDCPHPRATRCMRCGQVGHDRYTCTRYQGMAGRLGTGGIGE